MCSPEQFLQSVRNIIKIYRTVMNISSILSVLYKGSKKKSPRKSPPGP